jgi:AraC-like DNA-binding protein
MKSIGHTWNAAPRISPRLVTTVDQERSNPKVCVKCVNPLWVLDYSKVRIGWCRTGSPRAPWRPRSPRVAHLYPPLTPYWEDYTRDSPPPERSTYLLFHNGDDAGLTRFTQTRFRYARFVDRGGVLLPLMEETARIGQTRGEAGFWEAQALFCQVLGLLQRATPLKDEEYELPASAEAPAPFSFAAQVDDYLRTRLAERLRLAEVARRFHVSLSSLAHRYQSETGLSPMARLIQMRVNMARGLLLGGERLDLVAEQTGFYDAYHLSKTFKRIVGLPPRQFLQAARQDVRKGQN